MELPNTSVYDHSLSSAVAEGEPASRGTGAHQRVLSPTVDLESWITAARVLAEPDLACYPQVAVEFLCTMSSTQGAFTAYVHGL
jgi:hypothetical protein